MRNPTLKAHESELDAPDAAGKTSPAIFANGAALIGVLLFGIAATGFNPRTLDAPEDADIVTGEWATRYQSAYEDGLLIREPSVHFWALLRYAVFREGRPGVLIGENGWLFTDEEFAHHPGAADQIAHWLEYVTAVRDRLAEQDVGLVVALVPAKARIYPDRLGRYRFPDYAVPRYDEFRSRLVERGVPVPDLAAALSAVRPDADGFLRTDTHWTPEGALAAARALREDVVTALEASQAERRAFVREPGDTVRHEGDLLTFIPLGPFMNRFGPEPDTTVEYTTSAREEREVGLFDEISIPITLVGTSYSAGELWDFDGAVASTVDADVLNVATEGEGPFVPMQTYLDSDTLERSPPAVVIWEIPERYLPVEYPPTPARALDAARE